MTARYTPEDGLPFEMQQKLSTAMDLVNDATHELSKAVSNLEEHSPVPVEQFIDFPRARKLLEAIQQARN